MVTTLVLARNTFRESVRDRLLPIVLTFGALLVGASVLLAPLTLGEHSRVIRDLGLSSISLFTLVLIVMVGTGMVYREIERRTIHTILSQPVHRASFILGKFAGLYATILVSIALLGTMYLAVTGIFAGGFSGELALAVLLLALEALIMTSVAVFFSSVASPVLSAVFTLFLCVCGNLARDLKLLAMQMENPVVDVVMQVFYVVVPSLHNFHVRNNLLSGVPVDAGQIGYAAGYAALYSAAVLLVTIVAFERRDFE
ncbi:MAG TPA: ABC transporter permease [bacterium]|nr:ABC transporter permease [bacterium]